MVAQASVHPFRFGLLAGAGALVAYLGYRALAEITSIIVILLASALLAVAQNRAVLALRRRGMPRRAAVAVVLVVALGLVVVAMLTFVPFVVDQVDGLLNALSGYLDGLKGTQQDDLVDSLQQVLTPDRIRDVASGVFGGASAVAGVAVGVFSTLALTLYLLADFDHLSRAWLRLLPRSQRGRAAEIGDEILTKIGAYVVGVLAVAACAGTTALLFMLVTGVPYPLVLALVVAALDMIPQVGATLAATVVALVALSESLALALAAVAFFLVYQQIENWLIYPRVMRQAVRVSGLAAILSVLVGTAIAGVFGALVAVPVYAAAQIVVRQVWLPRQDAR
ncbi:AI-2E family transporter [Phytohabitans houttuyneae]